MAEAAPPDPGAAGLRVRVGHVTVPLESGGAVTEAIERSNAIVRVPDLPDALNPDIIDPAKAAAFLAALAKLPWSDLAPLAGHSVYLNAPELPVRTTSPTTPDSFSRLSGLEVADLQGDTALTRVRLPLDCALAEAQANSARRALADVDQAVTALERRHVAAENGPDEASALHALSAARARRFAIASTWLENASAVSACRPDDAKARADRNAAHAEVNASAMPSGPGMR
jgi:hypothetical protein